MAEKSSNKSLIIIVAVVVLLQMVFTFVFMTIILKKNNAPAQQVVQNSEESHSKKSSKKSKRKKKNTDEDDKDYIKDYTVYSLGDIVVNIPGEETHYLVVTIAFEYQIKDKKLPDELKNKDVLIKDRLNTYFGSKSLAELQDVKNRDKMKTDILDIVNNMLLEGEITKVLFAQFVIQ